MRVFGLLFCLMSLPALAITELTTQIHDIDYGTKPKDEVLFLLTSGHVAKVLPDNKVLLSKFALEKTKGKWFKITMDDNRFISGIEPTTPFLPAILKINSDQKHKTSRKSILGCFRK